MQYLEMSCETGFILKKTHKPFTSQKQNTHRSHEVLVDNGCHHEEGPLL